MELPSYLSNFLGAQLSYVYYFPDLSTPYDGTDSSATIFINDGIEIPDLWDFGDQNDFDDPSNFITLDVNSSQITVDFGVDSAFNPAAFSGFVLSDYLNQVAPIIGVSIN